MLTTSAVRGRFVWHELSTTDPSAAQEFYTSVLGWSTSKFDGTGMDYTMWMVGEAPVGGVMALPDEAKAMGALPSWLAYTEVPDVDKTVEEAVHLGASVIVPPHSAEDVGRFSILRDPQGAFFAVITSASPVGDENDPKPLEFVWHELVTTDPAAGFRFYDTLFGWEPKGDYDMGEKGPYKMFGRDRFTYGGVMKQPEGMGVPPHWLHYVSVDDADSVTERATKAGANVMLPPTDVPAGGRISVMSDPQGAMFAVHSNTARASA